MEEEINKLQSQKDLETHSGLQNFKLLQASTNLKIKVCNCPLKASLRSIVLHGSESNFTSISGYLNKLGTSIEMNKVTQSKSNVDLVATTSKKKSKKKIRTSPNKTNATNMKTTKTS